MKTWGLALAAVLAAGGAWAQDEPATTPEAEDRSTVGGKVLEAVTNITDGTVEGIDAEDKTVAVKSVLGDARDYTLTDFSHILRDGEEAELGSVKEGDRVTFMRFDPKTYRIRYLEIESAKP